MTAWTEEALAALREADWRYMRAWNKAMCAFDAEPDPGAATVAYNTAMAPALAAWQQEIEAAAALARGEPF